MTTQRLDRIDQKILDVLATDGRLPIARLAEQAGISASPCWKRVQRLEKIGVIAGYTADITLAKIVDVQIVIMQVALRHHGAAAYARFEAWVRKTPEIIECFAATGEYDYHLKLATVGMDRYRSLTEEMLADELGVDRVYSHVVTRTVAASSAYSGLRAAGGI